MTTFVTVGNATQPFDRLLEAVAAITAELPAPVIVQRGTCRQAHPGWQVFDYLEMGAFEEMVRNSRLVIMHGGAGSIINAVAGGKKPVVMPRRERRREHVDDHQLTFAEELEREGYVFLAREPEDLLGAVRAALAERPARGSEGPPPLVSEIAGLLDGWAHGR